MESKPKRQTKAEREAAKAESLLASRLPMYKKQGLLCLIRIPETAGLEKRLRDGALTATEMQAIIDDSAIILYSVKKPAEKIFIRILTGHHSRVNVGVIAPEEYSIVRADTTDLGYRP